MVGFSVSMIGISMLVMAALNVPIVSTRLISADTISLVPQTPFLLVYCTEKASRDIMRCSEVQCGLYIPSPDKNSVLCDCDQQTRPRRKHIGGKLKKTYSQAEQDFETRENLMFIRRRRLHNDCKIGQLSWKGVFNPAFIYL